MEHNDKEQGMMLEREIEQRIIANLSSINELSSAQIIGSRQFDKTEDNVKSVIAVSTAFRRNDSFSLPMVDIPVTIAITTRVEEDKTSELHETEVEKIADKLSYWHFYPDRFEEDLSCNTVLVGELTMNGGSDRVFDSTNLVWTETMQFNIRGSQVFSI